MLQAHHENASREISDYQQQVNMLKEEKFHLQQKIIELNHTMDEFRATIVSELSPSIGRYLGNNMTSTIQQTLSQSQSQSHILASSSTSPVGPRQAVSPPKSESQLLLCRDQVQLLIIVLTYRSIGDLISILFSIIKVYSFLRLF